MVVLYRYRAKSLGGGGGPRGSGTELLSANRNRRYCYWPFGRNLCNEQLLRLPRLLVMIHTCLEMGRDFDQTVSRQAFKLGETHLRNLIARCNEGALLR